MYLIICLIANNLCVFVNSGQYPSCGAPISAVVFPVLCGKYCSLMRKVLQYFSESTGVLTGQYWEKNRRCHPFLSGRHRRHFSTYPMILLMGVAQDETECPGIDQLLVRDGKAFQLLVAGCYLLDIDIFRFLMLGLDDQFSFRVVTLVELEAEMKVNSAYINSEGKATASTDLTSSVFKVLDKEIAGAYYYDGEYADKTTVVYSINESADDLKAIEDAGGTAPSISSDVLTWADWNKLELKVKAELTINDRVLDTKEFVVTIADPVAEAITADSEVDATIYAGETDKTFAIPSMLKLAAQKGSAIDAATNVFDAAGAAMGLNDDLKTALTGKATYTLAEGTNPIITISADGKGILTLADSALEINEFSVTVKVTYKYQFGERTFDATIKVKPGTKPVVTPAP